MKAQAKENLQRIADEFGLGANTKNIANEAYWRMIALGYKVYMINERYLEVEGDEYRFSKNSKEGKWMVKPIAE